MAESASIVANAAPASAAKQSVRFISSGSLSAADSCNMTYQGLFMNISQSLLASATKIGQIVAILRSFKAVQASICACPRNLGHIYGPGLVELTKLSIMQGFPKRRCACRLRSLHIRKTAAAPALTGETDTVNQN